MTSLLAAAHRAAAVDPAVSRALESKPAELEAGLRSAVLGLAGYRGQPIRGAAAALAEAERLSCWLEGRSLSLCLPRPGRRDWLAHHLGGVYEKLLELQVQRLASASVCVRPAGVWVSSNDVLRLPPERRAAWLKSMTGLPASSVRSLAQALSGARTEGEVTQALGPVQKRGTSVQPGGRIVLGASVGRRRAGAHYTPRELCRSVAERALEPLLAARVSKEILELRVCDPAMGSGAFLAEAAGVIAERLLAAWQAEGRTGATRSEALAEVATHCLYGLDRDPVARELCRFSLTELADLSGKDARTLAAHLEVGDALIGRVRTEDPRPPGGLSSFDWPERFPEIFNGKRPGFDACLGNPPWIAYVGRAAQPLARELHDHHVASNPAFRGYRTLHGLFVRRAAELLAEGGRLGLVLPTSVADLSGYAPTRGAHDELCVPDDELLDFGNGAFDGVFQPCMGLTSTRRSPPVAIASGASWGLRSSLSGLESQLLSRLGALPVLDPTLFGERGYQTTGSDVPHLARISAPRAPHTVALHEGIDVGELSLAPPSVFLDPRKLAGKLRPDTEWRRVAVLIRQTARYPIAAVSDGLAFRNSILAGFASDEWTAPGLAAYLNSLAVRWYHYTRHRDAREGMPQLKIGHLRALPALADAGARRSLHLVAEEASGHRGLPASARAAIDETVFDALGLSNAERQLVREWAASNPVPRPRRRV